MPEHIKALVVILFLAVPGFALAKPMLTPHYQTPEDFVRRRNLWIAVTLIGFLAHNFWGYVAATSLLLLMTAPKERNPLALFFFLLLTLPTAFQKLPTFGLVEELFTLNHPRVLILVILVPALFKLMRDPHRTRFGRMTIDKFFAAYVLVELGFLMANVTSMTVIMREAFYLSVDYFVPYYVASRWIKDERDLRDVVSSLVVAVAVMAPIAVFEFGKHWLLYYQVENILGSFTARVGVYMQRGAGLRAVTTAGHAIVLGYCMMIATILFAALSQRVRVPALKWLGWGALAAGLIASISRGPWIGTVLGLLVFVATGPRPAKRLVRIGMAALLALPFVLMSPLGDSVIRYLPFVGSFDEGSVDYRQRLLEVSLTVLAQNPILGVYEYMSDPRMEQLRQGQGIIDMTNTYLGVAMSMGLVGLSLFVSLFLATLFGLWRALRRVGEDAEDLRAIGRSLLGVIVAIMLTLVTVSPIQHIPLIYTVLIGMCAAFVAMVKPAASVRPYHQHRVNRLARPRVSP